eukprot:scaffold140_cov565-Prasinococcus_capsulatus_cf.AAC.23
MSLLCDYTEVWKGMCLAVDPEKKIDLLKFNEDQFKFYLGERLSSRKHFVRWQQQDSKGPHEE